ncbi:hypothetical protein SAMN04244570_2453 [Sporosarcina newyorkensis]|uniref:Uncharacterized protein n=1 Tax=Sporosarcina newyorkensis TaxID=759851 RepID=A0A1T4YFE0_9BACL|nr:hypothetical protein SAMN04244570_2453 [Sporosarcina newyorkensis]
MNTEKRCPSCNGNEFREGTDFMPIKSKKSSFSGSNKIYTFCLNCGEVVSIRIEDPKRFV